MAEELRLSEKFSKSYPYFSPEKVDYWVTFKKTPEKKKTKCDVFSLGLVILEAGNLIQKLGNLNVSEDRM